MKNKQLITAAVIAALATGVIALVVVKIIPNPQSAFHPAMSESKAAQQSSPQQTAGTYATNPAAQNSTALPSVVVSSIVAPPAAVQPVAPDSGRHLSASEGGTLKRARAVLPQGQASIKVGDRTFAPRNLSSHFERIAIAGKQDVPVTLTWPADNTSGDVFVHAIQGGKIDGAENWKRIALNQSKKVNFTFTPDASPGLYQVVLRRGTHEEALEFWVPTKEPKFDPPTLQ